ncbi:Uncharacterized protein OBRU01_08025, partial [Operophtera brumata]
MVCVEAGRVAAPIVLLPGTAFEASQILQVRADTDTGFSSTRRAWRGRVAAPSCCSRHRLRGQPDTAVLRGVRRGGPSGRAIVLLPGTAFEASQILQFNTVCVEAGRVAASIVLLPGTAFEASQILQVRADTDTGFSSTRRAWRRAEWPRYRAAPGTAFEASQILQFNTVCVEGPSGRAIVLLPGTAFEASQILQFNTACVEGPSGRAIVLLPGTAFEASQILQ